MDGLGQISTGQRLSNAIVADVRDLAQAIEQAKGVQHAGIDAHADTCVAGFGPLQSRPRGKGSFRQDRHRQFATTTGIVNIRSSRQRIAGQPFAKKA